jgi:hypothetical protein
LFLFVLNAFTIANSIKSTKNTRNTSQIIKEIRGEKPKKYGILERKPERKIVTGKNAITPKRNNDIFCNLFIKI